MVSGIILIDKPSGITSHDLVDRVRKIFGQKRVGHAGILDPLATGLMIVLLGKGTLFSQHLTGSSKRYRARLRFGKATDTFDAEGTVTDEKDPGDLPKEKFEEIADGFVGKINQLVPPYSAVKIQGKRMYKAARDGEKMPERYKEVDIDSIQVLEYPWPEVVVDIKCGAGTYVRSLAHEIGREIGCGGYLENLVRTAVGKFTVNDAISLQELEEMIKADNFSAVKPLVEAFPDKPTISIRPEYYDSILQGKPFVKRYLQKTDYKGPGGCLSLLLGPENKVLAIAKLNYNWGSFGRLESRDILGKYVRIIDEGRLRNQHA